MAENPNYPGEAHAALMRLYELGKIKPVVGARGTLKDVPEMLVPIYRTILAFDHVLKTQLDNARRLAEALTSRTESPAPGK